MNCPTDQIATGFGCIPTDPAGFVGKFYTIGLGLIGGVGILGIMYGGYLLMTSQGNPVQLQKGKQYIIAAISGILLAVFAYAFIQIIVVNTFHIPGIS